MAKGTSPNGQNQASRPKARGVGTEAGHHPHLLSSLRQDVQSAVELGEAHRAETPSTGQWV